mgnify:CR=1 FL=1
MLAKLTTLGFKGIDGFGVNVEVDVSGGLPSFNIVGLPDTNIKESRDRVISAIKNSGFNLPAKKIVINLAPAEIRKTGTHYDLPIALSILIALSSKKIFEINLSDFAFIGELALDGSLRPVVGILPMLISAREKGICRSVIIPNGNEKEAYLSGLDFYVASSLKSVFEFINGKLELTHKSFFNFDKLKKRSNYGIDLSDVKGQRYAKRAIEIAASGFHNIIMVGPPGSGKSMLAKRIITIMPPMSEAEILETTKIYSVSGLNKGGLITTRPFREPHHTISDTALIGGGSSPKPGEISLAHNGVLFLDEFPEFSRTSLEAMREPLETKRITISRVKDSVSYPANFLLVASANPCPCGYFGHPIKQCNCTPIQIKKYRSKLSGPIIDRIDMHIEMVPVRFDEWVNKDTKEETSADVYERVKRAIEMQKKRFNTLRFNSSMTSKEIRKYCKIDESAISLLENVMDKMGYSARSIDKIIKVARTISDLEGSNDIKKEHVIEAIHYRVLDKTVSFDGGFYE